ncbi:hypothetical protein H1D32_12105 [Anaerobacillus sp. CMMVII]|uniref:hypothetical protein n=1 Tax=Anaerobacillus sp. CMMVII TaxID=2755588 RepID=UPI0021B78EB0|nr:hypothetical protein [Anaerobacillus sp. CMMVII]MCT8138421.1 hypothetical protein [Anaerobacillus sp. CMMVII]
MKKQIDLHDLDARLKNLDEESHWNEEHSSKLKNRIFSDLKKSHSNKRTPYTYYVSLTVVGLLLWILVSPYISKEFNGFITTGANVNLYGPTPVQISFIVFVLFVVILVRKNKKINHLFKKTDSFYMQSRFMRDFFGKGFRILVSIFIFYLLLKGLTYINTIYEIKLSIV